MPRRVSIRRAALACAITLAAVSCVLQGGADLPAGGAATIEGTVASIDLSPWAYDGHAVVEVDTPAHGRVSVQLPARWNLCRAPAVDVDAIATGTRVAAVGEASDGKTLVVCSGPGHRLVPVQATP